MADDFDNRCRLLSNVLLFQMIFTFKRWSEAEASFRRRRALLLSVMYMANCAVKSDDRFSDLISDYKNLHLNRYTITVKQNVRV